MPLYDRTVARYWLESLGWDGRFQKTSLALGARVGSREPLGKGSGSVCSLYCPCLINAPARNGLNEFLRVPEIPEYKRNLSPARRPGHKAEECPLPLGRRRNRTEPRSFKISCKRGTERTATPQNTSEMKAAFQHHRWEGGLIAEVLLLRSDDTGLT